MHSQTHANLHYSSIGMIVTPALVVAALLYLRGWHRLRSALPGESSLYRLAAFLGGVFSLWVAVGSPLGTLDDELLTVHMVQHLLIMTVAAPLVLLGAPAFTLLNGLPRPFLTGVLMPMNRCLFPGRLERILAHPVFCWLASTVVVIGWHVPSVFGLGLQSARWHAVEQASFLGAGLLFWRPIVRSSCRPTSWPRWFVPVYLFLAILPCDTLSAFLTFCNRVVYPQYSSFHRAYSISPLEDQECAGALMWVWVTFAYLLPAATVTIRMLSPHGVNSRNGPSASSSQITVLYRSKGGLTL
jgi:cytochrome c oxidase assembly factor CtaG